MCDWMDFVNAYEDSLDCDFSIICNNFQVNHGLSQYPKSFLVLLLGLFSLYKAKNAKFI